MRRPNQRGTRPRQPPWEPEDTPTQLDGGLDELQALALWVGDTESALRAARLRRLLALVADLRNDPPVAVPAQRTAPPTP